MPGLLPTAKCTCARICEIAAGFRRRFPSLGLGVLDPGRAQLVKDIAKAAKIAVQKCMPR